MNVRRLLFVALATLAPAIAAAQDQPPTPQVMNAVRAAMAPALPFPASDELGSLPADGKATDPWMVKPFEPGDRAIEILANPLNEEHQRRAATAMAQIDQSIAAAQRRADVQYERAIAEAKRTGRSQDVDGVSLNDEGLAGARIDAESHVLVDVRHSDEPPTHIPNITTATSTVVRDSTGNEHFRESESTVSIGTLLIRLRGNEALIAEILRKSDWNSLRNF